MLSYLINNIKNSGMVAAANFFVCGFENLSAARLGVLGELCKRAKSVNIGAAAGGELQSQIQNMEQNIAVTVGLGNMKPFNELFSYPLERQNLDFCEVGVFDSVREEAETVAEKIINLVKTGVRLGDVTVLLADFDNAAAIWETVFTDSNIPLNIDVGRRLSEFAITKYLRDLVELKINDSAENTVAAIFNKHSGVEGDLFGLDNKIVKNNLRAGMFPDKIHALRSKDMVNLCRELSAVAEREENEVIRDKLKNIFDVIEKTAVCEDITPRNFVNLFWTLCSATKVSNIPPYNDRVLVAPVDDFVPTAVPYLFIGNCADGIFPKGQNDNDILLEADILGTNISPKPSDQRRRNRQHIVNILSGAARHVFLSVSVVNSAGETVSDSSVLSNLAEMGAKRFKPAPAVIKERPAAEMPPETPDNKIISCGRELFFAKPIVKTTMVERFYTCPYLNFIENGLRLRPREIYDLKPNAVGTIIHKAVEEYFRARIENGTPDIKSAVLAAFADPNIEHYINDKRNSPIVAGLEREIKFIINTLEDNLEKGEFAPYKVEYRVEKPIKNGYTLVGKVDRVDAAKSVDGSGHFAIFDYKTGAPQTHIAKSIYMGEKLQLPIYASYFNRGGNIAGAGYLPLSGGFAVGRKEIKINGFINKNDIELFDRGTGDKEYSSSVISTSPQSRQLVDVVVIDNLCKYADIMVNSAVDYIAGGVIAPGATSKNVCKYCPVRAGCRECEKVRGTGLGINFNDFGEVVR
jgi:ATP-dependent helicase/DNAse subunit B